MKIRYLYLKSHDIASQAAFYHHLLGKVAVMLEPTTLTVNVGRSRLIFEARDEPVAGGYHFAFNIPENQFADACTWLTERVSPIVSDSGETTFYSTGWDAHMVYFYDADGNIAELIARHTLENARQEPFGAQSLLNVSEIGIAADDVPQCLTHLKQQTGVSDYGGSSSTFAPLGDEAGLFIVAQAGRMWAPDTGLTAQHLPIRVVLEDGLSLSFPQSRSCQ